jgi:hypothetical protein
MFSRIQFAIPVLTVVAITTTPAYAIQRVASKLGVVEVRFGYAMPLGTNTGTFVDDFVYEDRLYEANAKDVYKEGLGLGIAFGQTSASKLSFGIGFQYVTHDFKDTAVSKDGTVGFFQLETPTYRQFDLQISAHYYPLNIKSVPIVPYAGVSISPGLGMADFRFFKDEYQITLSTSLDFGVDFKVWSAADNRSFACLSSINSWDFYGSGDRARHLQIGGGIKYFFKP